MLKILLMCLCFVISSCIVYPLGMMLVSVVKYNSVNFKFDLELLFFDNQPYYFIALSLFVIAPIIWLLLTKHKRQSKVKEDNDNYSTMATKREVKKNMLRVSFVGGSIILTLRDKIEILINPLIKSINAVCGKVAMLEKYKLKTVNKYRIDGIDEYKRSGLIVMAKKEQVYLDPSASHSLIVGTTNSGKSWSIILPMLIMTAMAGESAVVVDIKGELSELTAEFYKQKGYNVYFLDFLDTQNSDCWNPLHLGAKSYFEQKSIETKENSEINEKVEQARKRHKILYGDASVPFDPSVVLGKNQAGDVIYNSKDKEYLTSADYSLAQELFRDVVGAITTDPKQTSGDSFWNEEAGRVLEGYVHLLAEEGNSAFLNLPSLVRTLNLGDEIYKGEKTILQRFLETERTVKDKSRENLMTYVDSAENTRKSTRNVLVKHLNTILTSDAVKQILSNNTIDLEKIGREKSIIYIKVHDEKQTYYPLVTLFIKQLWQVLVNTARTSPNNCCPVPVNILFDEMGQFPKFDEIKNVLTAGRSRGVRLTAVVQGYDQLEAKYGDKEARTIKNNVMNTMYLLSGDPQTLEEISKRCGTKKVKKDKVDKEERNITPDRLSNFKLGEALLLRQRQRAYITKLLPFDKYEYFKNLPKYELKVKPKRNPEYFDIKEVVKGGSLNDVISRNRK